MAIPCPDLLAIYQTWLKIVKKEILQMKNVKIWVFFYKKDRGRGEAFLRCQTKLKPQKTHKLIWFSIL